MIVNWVIWSIIPSFSVGKASGSSTSDPSGVLQGIPSGVDDDSIASLEEDDHMSAGMTTFHPTSAMDQSMDQTMDQTMDEAMDETMDETMDESIDQTLDHDEELFKGERSGYIDGWSSTRVLTFHSQDLKANSPNWWPYISLLVIHENLVLCTISPRW